jgi:hypothetical protein
LSHKSLLSQYMGHILDLARARLTSNARTGGATEQPATATGSLVATRDRGPVPHAKASLEVGGVLRLAKTEAVAGYPTATVEPADGPIAQQASNAKVSAAEDTPGRALEARRRRVLEILDAHPDLKYAVITDSGAEPGVVVVQIGIRGIASGEIVIARARYDGGELLRALEAASTESR